MFRVEVGDKKEALFYAITLGCVLILVFGASRIYWSNAGSAHLDTKTQLRSPGIQSDTQNTSSSDQGAVSKTSAPHRIPNRNGSNQTTSLLFFGTVILALLLLFCLTFRYYTRREMKETEQKWKNACENFLTRMETERTKSEGKQLNGDALWSKVLKGEV